MTERDKLDAQDAGFAAEIDGIAVSVDAIVGKARFEVTGAGFFIVKAKPGETHLCGTAEGIGISCTWGRHGEAGGGVMDKSEVKKLIVYLQNWLA